jgi:hypothetical protein
LNPPGAKDVAGQRGSQDVRRAALNLPDAVSAK